MPNENPINIAMIGTGFMGRAHSHAWASVNHFFDPPRRARMRTVVGRDASRTRTFADRWGWGDFAANLDAVLKDRAIELIDIVTPNHLHAQAAIAALKAGKHVACEKPLAGTLEDARAMRDAARQARSNGVTGGGGSGRGGGGRGARNRKRDSGTGHTFVWFNYRRAPAVAFAHQLVKQKRLGRIYHVRAQYLQDWGGPDTPMSWRFQGDVAGSGAHGDLNAHIIDMARFITGDEIEEVAGAIAETFITKRSAGRVSRSMRSQREATSSGRSTVDDCVLFLARFESGAVGSFEATRLATGNLNRNTIEINGERGSLKFDFERMNELQWWDNTLAAPPQRGWSRILCTTPGDHPYIDAYWPPGHLIGYDHCFISQAADIIRVLSGEKPVVPLADFEDAYQTQRVLHAAMIAAKKRKPVKLRDVK